MTLLIIEPAFEATRSPADLVAVVESSYREQSALVAKRLDAVAALLRHRVATTERAERLRGYAQIDGFEQTTAEVAVEVAQVVQATNCQRRRRSGARDRSRRGPGVPRCR